MFKKTDHLNVYKNWKLSKSVIEEDVFISSKRKNKNNDTTKVNRLVYKENSLIKNFLPLGIKNKKTHLANNKKKKIRKKDWRSIIVKKKKQIKL